jgi:hypothetical protein
VNDFQVDEHVRHVPSPHPSMWLGRLLDWVSGDELPSIGTWRNADGTRTSVYHSSRLADREGGS